jgi:hypothetical protein
MYTRIFTWHVHGLVRIRLQDPSVHHTHDNMYAYTRLQDTITNKSECISIRDRRKKVGGGLSFVFSEVERLRGTVREEGRLPLTQRLQRQHDPVHPCRF